ncbi:MAG: hypothetical protein ACKVP4_09620 [Hyphomicrobium sp.]
MTRAYLRCLGALALTLGLSSAAFAESYLDVEHARANARAGGPVTEYDYEQLERWGHLDEIQYPRAVDGRRIYKKKRHVVDDRRW